MIVFALCLATFERFKQTLTQWSLDLATQYSTHSSGVVTDHSVTTFQHTSITNDWYPHEKKKKKPYTMNIHGRMQIYTATD